MKIQEQLRSENLRINAQIRSKMAEAEKEGVDSVKRADIEAEVTRMFADIDANNSRIKSYDRADEIDASMEVAAVRRPVESATGESKTRSVEDSFDAYLRQGEFRLSLEDRANLEAEYRDQSVGTPSAGGYLVPGSHAPTIVSTLKEINGPLGIVHIMETSDGGVWNQPLNDSTSYKARIIAENTAANTVNLTFGTTALNAFTYTTDLIRVSREALQDSKYDLAGFVYEKMGEAFARGLNEHLVVGTGSGQPQGIHTAVAATAGMLYTTAATGIPTADDFFRTQHKPNQSYRKNAHWLMNDATFLEIRLLKDGNGQYILKQGLTDPGVYTILGSQVVIADDMPAIANGAVPVLYGDFKKGYTARFVRGFSVQRLDERFAEQFQVAFIGYARADGKVIDSKAIAGMKVKAS